MDQINWRNVFAVECSYTVDSLSGGRFNIDMARAIAKEDRSVVKDEHGTVVEDFRAKK